MSQTCQKYTESKRSKGITNVEWFNLLSFSVLRVHFQSDKESGFNYFAMCYNIAAILFMCA